MGRFFALLQPEAKEGPRLISTSGAQAEGSCCPHPPCLCVCVYVCVRLAVSVN